MFVALLAHADTAEPDCLKLLDASGTQTNENQRHNAQRVGVRRLSYIPYADLM